MNNAAIIHGSIKFEKSFTSIIRLSEGFLMILPYENRFKIVFGRQFGIIRFVFNAIATLFY